MIPCSSGSSAGRDLLDAQRGQRDLVRGEQLHEQQHDGDDDDHARARARREQHADEHDVDQPEQEHRQEHPRLQAGVLAEARIDVLVPSG